jgi:diguanylate cyclase (GGDEF)-like protein
LERAVERAKRRDDYLFGVVFLDLDHFKDVNDSLGHLVGDQLLVSVGQMLMGGLRTSDTLARFSGDEFIILLEDITDISGVERVSNWILEAFTPPFQIMGREVYMTASIGIVVNITQYDRAIDIVRDADIAMYVAKSRGRSRAEIFTASMRDRIMDRLTMETHLRRAIDIDQLFLYYQPIVLLETGRLVGFEALVRWEHPTRGVILPGEFISLAEESGLVIAIDRWVLRTACKQMREWQDNYPIEPAVTISTNISGKHLGEPDLGEFIEQVLEETGLEAKYLKLEITERTIVDFNERTTSVFAKLQMLGVQIQIDDFGTGYSSLGYLTRFPINALKIDQSFVKNMVEDSNQMEIIQAIVGLTGRLNVKVIAEGVETNEQFKHLQSVGSELGQGIFFAPPLDATSAENILRKISAGETENLLALSPVN